MNSIGRHTAFFYTASPQANASLSYEPSCNEPSWMNACGCNQKNKTEEGPWFITIR